MAVLRPNPLYFLPYFNKVLLNLKKKKKPWTRAGKIAKREKLSHAYVHLPFVDDVLRHDRSMLQYNFSSVFRASHAALAILDPTQSKPQRIMAVEHIEQYRYFSVNRGGLITNEERLAPKVSSSCVKVQPLLPDQPERIYFCVAYTGWQPICAMRRPNESVQPALQISTEVLRRPSSRRIPNNNALLNMPSSWQDISNSTSLSSLPKLQKGMESGVLP